MPRPLVMMTLLVGLGCKDDAPVDSGESPWGACAPFSMELVQEWDQDALLGPGAQPHTDGDAGIGLGDFDGDGWLDAFIVTPEGSLLLQNDDSGQLVEGGFEVEGGVPEASGVAIADVDGDGDLDAWLGRRSGVDDLLLRNDGVGHFSVETLPDSQGEHYSGSFGDLDGDGDLDLFVSGYAPLLTPEGILSGEDRGDPSLVYLNVDGQLQRAADALPEEVVDDVSFLGQLLDVDADGDLDLYLANDFGPWLGRNRLLLNDGAAHFSPDDDCACDKAMFAMGVGVGDPDGDLDLDLYLTDLAGPDLLLNDGQAGYYDASAAMNASVPNSETHLAAWGTAFVDLDRDGWEDLPMVFGPLFPQGDPDGLAGLGAEYEDWIDGSNQRDVILRNLDGQGFVDVSDATGFTHDGIGRGLAVGDLNRDGRPDLVTGGLWYAQSWAGAGGCEGGVTFNLAPEASARWLGHSLALSLSVDGGEPREMLRSLSPATTWSSSAHQLILGLGALQGEEVEIEVRDALGGGAQTYRVQPNAEVELR
ncbi:MAG: VCBS repeat-containing protein [Alphaproteobacteria bacterium]|nr:VCBS repeat-containing protein [Alphaproteobacteria bacterium]MCB9795150.1 VCBS repeat-containing protein [Alphaproteobacteria bacterium]